MIPTINPKIPQERTQTATRYNQTITFKTGLLAPHCDGAVEITVWWTTLLVTAVMQKHPSNEKNFLPLWIEFRESYYATGKIWWGRFRKREWRPSDDTVLYARLTDRTLRPLFPKGMVNETVITISPFSLDLEHSPGEISIIGASIALLLWGIPFWWPVGAARIGYKDWKFLINPTESEIQWAIMDLHVAWTKTQINMIEAWCKEVSPEILKEWLRLWQEVITACCAIQEQFLQGITITQLNPTICRPTPDMQAYVDTLLTDEYLSTLEIKEKNEFEELYQWSLWWCREQIEATEDPVCKGLPRNATLIYLAAEYRIKSYFKERILRDGIRADGRKTWEIRPIYCNVGRIPTAHGTWLFWRWDTQALTFLTLGAPWDAELTDDMEHTNTEKRFMHHYKMPPFSNNEAQMIRGTSRREIGHGRLAEKALEAVIPSQQDFPYTMRLVSEILWSWWSTSMASTCASTLALMDGGVPITAPVSWIAMWLVKGKNGTHQILTDIMGIEDYLIGDMDFKLAGTTRWITAIQMDIKLAWIDVDLLTEIVDHSQRWREAILQFMLQTLPTPRDTLSPHAPLLISFQVKPEQIREIIGKWWETIQEITRITDVKIDLEDDGRGVITAKKKENWELAYKMIQDIVWTPSAGMKLNGTIVRTEKYGVFVDLWKKKQGLVHVKNLWQWFIEDASALFKIGDMIAVEIIGIDNDGKIQLKKQIA
jgi:polyribonucleotide nucleotidyltransferase